MKNLVPAALAALVLTSSAFAYNPKDPAPIASAPAMKLVPTSVVNPSNLPRSFTRGIVTLEFSLDANGQPKQIEVLSKADRNVRERVVRAFQQWKFDPSAAGQAKRFVLPIEVVVDSGA